MQTQSEQIRAPPPTSTTFGRASENSNWRNPLSVQFGRLPGYPGTGMSANPVNTGYDICILDAEVRIVCSSVGNESGGLFRVGADAPLVQTCRDLPCRCAPSRPHFLHQSSQPSESAVTRPPPLFGNHETFLKGILSPVTQVQHRVPGTQITGYRVPRVPV